MKAFDNCHTGAKKHQEYVFVENLEVQGNSSFSAPLG